MEKAITTYLALTEGYIQEVASDLFFSPLLFSQCGERAIYYCTLYRYFTCSSSANVLKPHFPCLTHLGTPGPVICVWVPLDSGMFSDFIGPLPPFAFPSFSSRWGRPGSRLLFSLAPAFLLYSGYLFVGL